MFTTVHRRTSSRKSLQHRSFHRVERTHANGRDHCHGCCCSSPGEIFARPSPVRSCTYVESVAGQVRPQVREHLLASALTVWSLCDAVCWPSRPPEEAVREWNCWLCRGDNCRPGTRRLVGRVAAAVELGFWPRRHEAGDGFVPRCPRLCAHVSPQRLAPCVCGWLHSGNRRRARSEPGPVQSRAWHRSLVGTSGCGWGTMGGPVQGDTRDSALPTRSSTRFESS